MRQETSAGIVVFYHDQSAHTINYLLLKYPGSHWDFPKGKLEGSESLQQAAIRETKEETNLDITIFTDFEQSLSYYFRGRDGETIHKTVTFFIGKAARTDVTLSFEHKDFAWLSYRTAQDQLTFDNARHILRLADDVIQEEYEDAPA